MGNLTLNANQKTFENTIDEFKRVAEDYSNFMIKYNRTIGAWNNRSLEAMAAKGDDYVQFKTSSLKRQLNYYKMAEKENIGPDKESQVLWRLLREEKWKFPSDLFPKLSDNDVIEVYLADSTQYFANSTFMMNCSYDLSDLNAYSWPELFERPFQYTQQIIETVTEIFKSSNPKTVDFNIPTHFGREIFSREKRTLEIKMGVCAPIFGYKKNEVIGVIATFTPKQILN